MSIAEPPTNGHPAGLSGAAAPPQNLEAEQAVLGAVLLTDTALPALIIDENLQPDDFYREAHALIFQAMLALHTRNDPVDALTVVEYLKQAGELERIGGQAAIDMLSGPVPGLANVRNYARIVRENAMLRRLLKASYEIQQRVHHHEAPPRELVDMAERAILEVAHTDRRKDFRAIEDVLEAELTKLERLSQEGTSITGTRSGFDDLDSVTGGFQPGNLIILAARPAMGKCLAGHSLVIDPRDGSRRRIDELVAAHEAGEEVKVVSVGADLRLRANTVSAVMRSGVQQVFRLTTRLGRRVELTANHPLMTLEGWRELRELRPGDRIAVPRRLPRDRECTPMPDHELVLLAALIGDGNLTNKTPRFCFGKDSQLAPLVAAATAAAGAEFRWPDAGHGDASLAVGRWAGPNPVTELLRDHGLWGLRSEAKFIPAAIFRLPDDQLRRFLSVLFAADGHISASERFSQVGYTTISESLARDVQHLLLQIGVVASIRTLKRDVHAGTEKVAREVRVTHRDSLDAFANLIPVVGKTDKLAIVGSQTSERAAYSSTDTLPVAVWERVREAKGMRSWADISATAGRPRNHNLHVGRSTISRYILADLALALENRELLELAGSDLWWDEVASIEPIGDMETFDLEVPGDHNFVADDIVVHNSALMANFCENAALGDGKAVALFSLEMSESELAQRFIASQASIKGDDLRKGRVQQSRWGKIMDASNRLAASPLFIDDSSDLSVLDVRAKSRRLKQQNPDGLGLIVIDYLQLMRGDGATDNRVEQIGQISRGLKTLARELEVPVIALSQLNRGVEQRTDKRPVLSDLRESGSIEQDADLVMFIYRDEYYHEDSEREGIADLIISKHRNGGLKTIELTFQKEYPRFMSYVGEDAY